MARKHCKCCGLGLVDGEDNSFDVCHVCGWEDDGLQNDDPDFAGGANALSLNDYRRAFEEKRRQNPSYAWAKDIFD